MIPISDDNPTLRTPLVTIGLLGALGAVWVWIQGAGLHPFLLGASVCNYGLVPGELTGLAPVGLSVRLGQGLFCVVDREPVNVLTPLTSMFLHGSWSHLLGNGLFLWVFGKSIEDSMGRFRFLSFYILCGLVAAATQTIVTPTSAVPMVGASGAISGVMGAYLVLFPRARVNILFIIIIFIRIIALPAYLVLLWWIGWQVLTGLPELTDVGHGISSGVAVWAHIGGFFGGVLLVKLFENQAFVHRRVRLRRRMYDD